MSEIIEADYVVVGAGAMGLAFIDTLLHESDATVILLDRRDRPGGHWTDAYPFVRLHQPSAFYGVNSRPLGSNQIDQWGWNAGLHELATGGEVCAYFDHILYQQFLPSGRVQYLPLTEYLGDGLCRSRINGNEFTVRARRRMVNAGYMNVLVPAMRPPRFAVDPGQRCVPVNDLPRQACNYEHFTIVGAGKTGMDACLWLLSQQVDPARIRWIMPRDSWVLDRRFLQPGPAGVRHAVLSTAAEVKAAAESTSIDDLFERLGAGGVLMRLDDSIRPTMYRCATVTPAELEQLRRIDDVVRLGRVEAIQATDLKLDQGSLPIHGSTLHVDCSADGLQQRPAATVFSDGRLELQSVRVCQQVFSAALIAHVELMDLADSERNALCQPIPHPDKHTDWILAMAATRRAQGIWEANDDLRQWLAASRLNLFRDPTAADINDEVQAAMVATAAHIAAATEKVGAYVAELSGTRD